MSFIFLIENIGFRVIKLLKLNSTGLRSSMNWINNHLGVSVCFNVVNEDDKNLY